MDVHLDDDQLALQENVARFCRGRWPLERAAERPTGSLDRAGWDALVELGLTSAMVDESRGGLGLGVVEGAVLFEQLGRHLVPGPCLWSALAAFVVADVATGERMAGGTEDRGQSPLFVEHACEVDTLVVLREGGVSRIDRGDLPPALSGESLDPLNPLGVFPSLPAGIPVGDAAEAQRLRRVGAVLTAALQLGIADAALDVAVGYSLEREQFGVPIGSFQALKHIMADMYVRVELARSATYAAAAVLDDPEVGDAPRSVGAAKLLAGEAALENARASVQVLGGMGFTWEMTPHFLLKRAWVLDHAFGTPTQHALAIAQGLAKEVA
jgi:alkylation response protein AidB-like acyl-CoA dehydrogenase